MTTLVSSGRQVKPGHDAIGKLGKCRSKCSSVANVLHDTNWEPEVIKKPFQKYSPTAIIKYLMYLPLNLIPGVGTVLFVILQGKAMGPAAHQRYFQLKGFSNSQREEWIEQHRGAYTR